MFENFGDMLIEPTKNIVSDIISVLPSIVYAIIILLFGWILSSIIAYIFRKVLEKIIKLDKLLEKHELDDALGDISLTKLSAKLLFWWIFLVFIGQAAMQLKLMMISDILIKFIVWTPNLFYGIFIMMGGLYFADFLSDKIKKSKNIWADRIGLIVEPIIVFFIALIALGQIGINITLITDLIKIFFITICLGIALAIGLAFGLGMKGEAPKIWTKLQHEWNKQRK